MLTNDFFEIAKNHFDDGLPFVLYRKPNALKIKGIFQKDTIVYTSDELTESGFVFAPFNTEEQAILIPNEGSQLLEVEYDSSNKTIENNSHRQDLTNAKIEHLNLVSKGINAIEKRLLKKVVLSRKEVVNLSKTKAITLFNRLLKSYKNAFVYCWYHPKIGLWLGATPETLVNVTANRFTTMALAGTQSFQGKENVSWENKEKEEQELVTNYIVDSLKTSVNNLTIGNTETVKAGDLLHIRTKVTGVINSNLKALVHTLHPTPAVCGVPKDSAKQFILKHENYSREFYTGFLGELNVKEKTTRNSNRRNVENNAYAAINTVTNLFVNLRCMKLTDKTASVYVGGGITKDSNPEKEWEETVNKTQTMKKVLF